MLSALLASAMDRIEQIEREKRPVTALQRKALVQREEIGDTMLLGTAEVAELLGVSNATARKVMQQEGGFQFDAGGRWMMSPAALKELIDSGKKVSLGQ